MSQAGEVVFQWVPGHSGFIGNERADQEAKLATTPQPAGASGAQPQVPVTYRSIKTRFSKRLGLLTVGLLSGDYCIELFFDVKFVLKSFIAFE